MNSGDGAEDAESFERLARRPPEVLELVIDDVRRLPGREESSQGRFFESPGSVAVDGVDSVADDRLAGKSRQQIDSFRGHVGALSDEHGSPVDVEDQGSPNCLDVGRYGDGSMGETGGFALSGFTSTKSAERSAPQAVSVARSRRSPIPHEVDERSW